MSDPTRTALNSTPDHERCFKVACELLGPLYRWDSGVKIHSVWDGGFELRARVFDAATVDMDELTRMVIAAHQQSVRFEISARPPASTRLTFTCREPGRRSVMTQHPSLHDLADRVMAEAQSHLTKPPADPKQK